MSLTPPPSVSPLDLPPESPVPAPPRGRPVLAWLAILAVVAPAPALLILIAVWKLATELLFPMSGAPIWEFVERGGSYAAPIALVILFARSAFTPINLTRSSR